MVTLIVAFLLLGFSFFIIWFFGFSQEEVEKIDDTVVVVAAEEDVNGHECTSHYSIKSAIDTKRSEDFPYAQLWRYPAQSKANFRWPEEAATLVDIQRRKEGATELSTEMRMKLKDMGILRKQSAETQATENIADIARTTGILMPRKNLWVTFDTFAAKSRPGLAQSSEDEDSCNIKVVAKKKKKMEETAKKNVEIMKWKDKHTNLFQQEKEDLIKFVKGEKSGFVRSF
jgi:hypothetical protein